MCGVLCGYVFDASVAKRWQVNVCEEPFTRAKQNRRHGNVQLVNQAGANVLLDRSDTTTQSNIFAIGGINGARKSAFNPIGDEMECRATGHSDRLARVMSQNEDSGMIRWSITPPALPVQIRPGSANRPEHVTTKNPSTHVTETASSKVIINTRRAATFPVHVLKGFGMEGPFVQSEPSNAKRILEVLIRSRTESVNRYGKTLYAQLGHFSSFARCVAGFRYGKLCGARGIPQGEYHRGSCSQVALPKMLGRRTDQLVKSRAFMAAFLPGSAAEGIVDLLFGDAKPTASLSMSWPNSMAQVPINLGDPGYDTTNAPLFPVGYGLTY